MSQTPNLEDFWLFCHDTSQVLSTWFDCWKFITLSTYLCLQDMAMMHSVTWFACNSWDLLVRCIPITFVARCLAGTAVCVWSAQRMAKCFWFGSWTDLITGSCTRWKFSKRHRSFRRRRQRNTPRQKDKCCRRSEMHRFSSLFIMLFRLMQNFTSF